MARITISAAAKRGFASRPTLYRALKDGRLTAQQDGDRKTLDLADQVNVFGEPGAKTTPAAKPDVAGAVHLEADRDRLPEHNRGITISQSLVGLRLWGPNRPL